MKNPTCRLCVKRVDCPVYIDLEKELKKHQFLYQDFDDLFVELGKLCYNIEIEKGQE